VRLVNYGKYVLVQNVGDKLIFATDSVVIGLLMPISSLTYYAIGGSLVEYLRSFIASTGSLLTPMSSSLEARKETDVLGRVFLASAKYTVLLGTPFCIGFVLLGERFIGLWMGPAYAGPAGQVLAVLAVGHLIGLPYYPILNVLLGLARHRAIALSRVAEGSANVLLSVLLIERFGLVGVAAGTAIPQVVMVAFVLPWLMPRALPIDMGEYYVSTYARPFMAAVPFAAACWVVANAVEPGSLATFFLWGLLTLPVYLVSAWFVGLTTDERLRVNTWIRGKVGSLRQARNHESGTVPCEP
jgi:O-antigen/teichoic acid export membrane protein